MTSPHPSSAELGIGAVLPTLVKAPLNWLLVALPLAIALKWFGAGGIWIFAVACLGIIPLAGLMGHATEHISDRLGPAIGGLLNATFGNAAELILALMFLRAGPSQYPVVKASLTGSIIGNLLLVLGLAILTGGLRYRRQVFNRVAAGMGSTLLALAAIGLLVPSLYKFAAEDALHEAATVAGTTDGSSPPSPAIATQGTIERISEEIALVLAIAYGLSLVFSLRTHQHLFAGETEETPAPAEEEQEFHARWSRGAAFTVLVLATVGVAFMSELLVHSVEEACEALGMNTVFVGVIVVAIVGNAAEHSTAVIVALKNKMDLAINIAVGSSIQIAMFVAPVLVFASLLMGHPHPLDLHFSLLEVIAVVLSVLVLALVAQDGESHWMEGVLLLAVYAVLGLAFYHLPQGGH